MNYTFEIKEVLGYPELNGFSNVIATVEWLVTFEQDGGISFGGGKTSLDTSTIDQNLYVDIQDVSEQQIIDWVIQKEGGEEFINQLIEVHRPVCLENSIEKQQQPLPTSFTSVPDMEPVKLEPIK